jgi:hypothetical protein
MVAPFRKFRRLVSGAPSRRELLRFDMVSSPGPLPDAYELVACCASVVLNLNNRQDADA